MRSPPTSRASAAISSVVVISTSSSFSERMRPVRSNTILNLEQQLIGRTQALVVSVAELGPNLAEFAGPICQDNRLLPILCAGTEEAIGLIDAHAAEPAPRELVLPRKVVAEGLAQAGRLLAIVPHHFRTGNEGVVNGAAQRLPAERRIRAVN